MNTRLVCASHSPLMYCYKKEPERWEELQTAFKEQARLIEEFDPELVTRAVVQFLPVPDVAFTFKHLGQPALDLRNRHLCMLPQSFPLQ